MSKRWIFKKENIFYRYIFISLSIGLLLVSFLLLKSLELGSFFLFISAYFLGAFKGRKKIEVIQNQSMETAISEICKLMDSATKNIYILTGGLNQNVYNQVDVLNSIKSAKSRGVVIKIITNYSKVKSNYKFHSLEDLNNSILKMISEKRIELFDIDKDLSRVNHFIVVDRTNFRFEQIHGEDEKREAIIVYRSHRARKLQNLFEELLEQSSCRKVFSDEIKSILDEMSKNIKEVKNED